VVITDLSGTAYAGGSASITQALQSLNDLEQEVNRNVIRIDPVKNQYQRDLSHPADPDL